MTRKGYRKPVCKRGHPRTPGNLYITQVTRKGRVYENRKCRICRRDYMRGYMRRVHAAKKQEGASR